MQSEFGSQIDNSSDIQLALKYQIIDFCISNMLLEDVDLYILFIYLYIDLYILI